MFGWVYWALGLVSAMLAHVTAEFVKLGLMPLVTQQARMVQGIIAGSIVVLVMIETVVRPIRAVLRDSMPLRPSTDCGFPDALLRFWRHQGSRLAVLRSVLAAFEARNTPKRVGDAYALGLVWPEMP